jgi:uncharacterized protein (UPF0332 family)
MDTIITNYLERAENEIILSDAIMRLCVDNKSRQEFIIPKNIYFYSAIISHSYYAIFYSAKAMLLLKGKRTSSPNVHSETLNAFKKDLVDNGFLDFELFKIYKKTAIKAMELYGIFIFEKRKRGIFTYTTLPQADKDAAQESLKNSKFFVSHIKSIINAI